MARFELVCLQITRSTFEGLSLFQYVIAGLLVVVENCYLPFIVIITLGTPFVCLHACHTTSFEYFDMKDIRNQSFFVRGCFCFKFSAAIITMDMHKGFSIDFSLSLIFLKGISSELTFPYGCQLRLDFHNLDLLSRNEKGEIFLYTKQQRSTNRILGDFTSCIYFRTLRDKIKLIRGGPV